MASNPYSYVTLGTRWSEEDPTSEDALNVSRINADANRWTLSQLLSNPDSTPFTLNASVIVTEIVHGSLEVTGASTFAGTLTVGVNGTGHDVKFWGDTADAYMLWDESADDLKLVGAAGLTVAGTSALAVTTTGALTPTGAIDQSGGAVAFNQGSGDYDFKIESDGTDNIFHVDGGVNGGKGSVTLGYSANPDGNNRAFFKIYPPAITTASGKSTAWVGIQPDYVMTMAGTVPVAASLAIEEPNISGTPTLAATLYIKDAPTEGGTNAALYVAAGDVLLGGNVGIGTSSPSSILHTEITARNTVYDPGDWTTWSDIHVVNPQNTGSGVFPATGISFAVDANDYDNGSAGIAAVAGDADSEHALAFITRPDGAVSAERMRITSAGHVGIGTSSPAEPLEVSREGTANNAVVQITGGEAKGAYLKLFADEGDDNADKWQVVADENNDFSIQNLSTGAWVQNVIVDASGHVGIGISPISSILHTSDNTSVQHIHVSTATNTVLNALTIGKQTSGTAANGLGVGLAFNIEDTGGADRAAASIDAVWTNATSRLADLVFNVRASAGISEVMRLNSSGNVGIGTDDPDVELHIETATAQPIIQVESTGSNSYPSMRIVNDARTWQMYVDGTDSDKFKIFDVTANSPRLAIDASGHVGIGTSTPLGDLHIESTYPHILLFDSDATSGSKLIRLSNSNGAFAIAGRADNNQGDGTVPTYLSFDNTGNVGIGTATPDLIAHSNYPNVLTVFGSTSGSDVASIELASRRSGADQETGIINFWNSESGGNRRIAAISARTGVSAVSYATESGQLAFYTATTASSGSGVLTERMRINSSGNVGIGVSPTERLTVQEDNNSASIGILVNQNGTNDAKVQLHVVGGSGGGNFSMRVGGAHGSSVLGAGNWSIYDEDATANRLLIDASGNVGIGTNDPDSLLTVGTGEAWIGPAAASGNTSNANMTVGLTINQAANDDLAFCLKSSDVTAGTIQGETDDWFTINKVSATGGGALLKGFTDTHHSASEPSFRIRGYSDDSFTNTAMNTSGHARVEIEAHQHNSVGATAALASDTNIFAIRGGTGASSATEAKWILDEDGDTWQKGGAIFSGNVGIGTGAPVEELHLHKAASTNCTLRITNAATAATVNDGLALTVDGTGEPNLVNLENTDFSIQTSHSTGTNWGQLILATDNSVHFRSDVNHGHTTITDNDTYFRIKEHTSDGGAELLGVSKQYAATTLRGLAEAPNTTDTTGGIGVVNVNGIKTDGGTSWGDCADGENIFSVSNGGAIPTTRVIIKGDGTVHASDTSWATALDDIPDAIAGRAYTTEMALRQGRGILGGMQITNPALVQRMEDAGIVTHAELPGEGRTPGHRFLNVQKSIKFSWDMGFQNFQWMAELAKVLTDKQRSKLPSQMRDAFTMLEERF